MRRNNFGPERRVQISPAGSLRNRTRRGDVLNVCRRRLPLWACTFDGELGSTPAEQAEADGIHVTFVRRDDERVELFTCSVRRIRHLKGDGSILLGVDRTVYFIDSDVFDGQRVGDVHRHLGRHSVDVVGVSRGIPEANRDEEGDDGREREDDDLMPVILGLVHILTFWSIGRGLMELGATALQI